jgi:hypothetical protein
VAVRIKAIYFSWNQNLRCDTMVLQVTDIIMCYEERCIVTISRLEFGDSFFMIGRNTILCVVL